MMPREAHAEMQEGVTLPRAAHLENRVHIGQYITVGHHLRLLR